MPLSWTATAHATPLRGTFLQQARACRLRSSCLTTCSSFKNSDAPQHVKCPGLRRPCLHNHIVHLYVRRVLRKTIAFAAADDWMDLAKTDPIQDEDDPDFVAAINEVCNRSLRVFLKEDIQLAFRLQDDLSEMGTTLIKQGNKKAALFFYVLYMMAEHKIATRADELEGMYKEAFEKMFGILEDSGWSLVPEKEDEAEEEETA